MRVCLVSRNNKLSEFVSEVVGASFSCSLPDQKPAVADLYLWDFEPSSGLPKANDLNGSNHLYLVDRKDLATFGEQVQPAPVCMLLKPLSRPTFEAFLETYRKQWTLRSDQADAQMLRSDRDVLLQHLLQANLKLQEYDQERTNFLARALHDLRAPLMALQGICDLLVEGRVGPINSEQGELLHRMRRSTKRLARLSSGMFELSVHGRVRRTLQLEPGDINTCVDQALHEVSALIEEKQLRILLRLDPPQKTMLIETPQIEQLLINLLENACKFTPRSGEIDIHGYSVYWNSERPRLQDSAEPPNAYRIDIKDSGQGIEPAWLEAIFEQYTSYGGSNDRSGGGLGLAICKLVVSAHGGRIWATSSEQGATFSLVLPFEPRVAACRTRLMNEVIPPPATQDIAQAQDVAQDEVAI
jgi:signal transduction histidine kinase